MCGYYRLYTHVCSVSARDAKKPEKLTIATFPVEFELCVWSVLWTAPLHSGLQL